MGQTAVELSRWSIEAVTEAEADAWWENHRPEPLEVQPMDTSVEALTDCRAVIDETVDLADAIGMSVPVFGGKATNMAAMTASVSTCQRRPALPFPSTTMTPTWRDTARGSDTPR